MVNQTENNRWIHFQFNTYSNENAQTFKEDWMLLRDNVHKHLTFLYQTVELKGLLNHGVLSNPLGQWVYKVTKTGTYSNQQLCIGSVRFARWQRLRMMVDDDPLNGDCKVWSGDSD